MGRGKRLLFRLTVFLLLIKGNIYSFDYGINQNKTVDAIKHYKTSIISRPINNCHLSPLFHSEYLEIDTNNKTLNTRLLDNSIYYGKQFVIGELCGVGCAYLSLFASMPFAPKDKGLGIMGYGANIFYIGYTVGNALGVYWVGNTRYKSSFLKTLIGSAIGASLGMYIMNLSDISAPPYSYAAIFGPVIGSMISYNILRNEKKTEMISFSRKQNDYYLTNKEFSRFSLNKSIQINIVQICF